MAYPMDNDEVMSETEQIVEAKWDYQARQTEELNIKRSEKLILLDDSKSWWQVKKTNGEVGYVPSNFVKKVKPGFGSKIVSSIIKPKQKKASVGENRRPASPGMNPHERTPTSEPDGDDTFELRIAAVVKFNYTARQEDELSLQKGVKVIVQEKSSDGWWRGECNAQSGWFPSNYVTEEPDSASGSQKSSISSRGEDSAVVEDFIHGVITLYPFTGRNDEELNFEQGERLDIVEIPENDPEWWKARNKNGEIGLVPKNYVQVLDSATPFTGNKPSYGGGMLDMHNNHDGMMGGSGGATIGNVPIEQKDWFHGRITRDESERILQDAHEDGIFLIRESETAPGDFSVSVKAPGRIKHFKVKNNASQYCIGTRQFDTLDDLVDHYKRAPIFSSTNGSFKLYLTRPFLS